MKIVLLTKEFDKYIYGGAGIHVNYLSDALKTIPGLEVHTVAFISPQFDSKKVYKEFIDLFERVHADTNIIHCHTWYTFEAGILLKKRFQKKLILTFHSVEKKRPWKANQLGLEKHKKICELEKKAAQLADSIIAVSKQCKQDIIEAYGIAESKIRVIYNGINRNMLNNALDRSFLKEWNIDQNKPSVLVVNRISEQKDLKFLFSVLDSIDQRWQIILCLNSPDDEKIALYTHQKIKKLGSHVIWINEFIPHYKLSTLYQIARVFISSAKYEPFGLTTAEAILHRCPVIVRDAGGIREILVHTQGGILCPLTMSPEIFTKHLDSFLDENIYKKIKTQMQDQALYDWNQIALETSKNYMEVLGS